MLVAKYNVFAFKNENAIENLKQNLDSITNGRKYDLKKIENDNQSLFYGGEGETFPYNYFKETIDKLERIKEENKEERESMFERLFAGFSERIKIKSDSTHEEVSETDHEEPSEGTNKEPSEEKEEPSEEKEEASEEKEEPSEEKEEPSEEDEKKIYEVRIDIMLEDRLEMMLKSQKL